MVLLRNCRLPWLEVGWKVKIGLLVSLQFFDVRMGGEASSEEADRTLFFSNIFCKVSAMNGCKKYPF